MSRFLIRSAANNLSKLLKNAGSVSLKSESCLGAACQNLMKCTASMTQPLNRQFSTKVEKDFAKFLDEEVKHEETMLDQAASQIGEFKVQSLDDSNIVLTRKLLSETITVKFNINGSLVTEGLKEHEEAEELEEDGDLVSRPVFNVEINKGAQKNLLIEVNMQGEEGMMPEGKNYDIQMFALVKNGQELQENDYVCDSSVMDENLYNYLMKMLEERGIDQQFVNELSEWSTNYEKIKYMETLKNLQKFVSH